ncbi:ABC transporter substrate-binding protein [Tepidiphilus olei]|uniref:ABC transporter substrate-binding protein n=1 Tax=Tepidiphilus olei TaxID=2502184 RepID=UPI00115D5CA8|nr:ABC transporter substrate-binding protein [Tepidiphilus olei]
MKTRRGWHRQLFVMVAFFACVAQAQEGPRRIVSVNLCADQLLLRLAPERVIAITMLSRRGDLAPDPSLGADKPAIRGSAEEILALKPDLVVFGPFSAAATRSLLERLGLPVYTLPYVESLPALREAIRTLGQLVHEPERAAALERRLDTLARPFDAEPPPILYYLQGGYSAGHGTWVGELIERSGGINAAARAGLIGYGDLPLERALAARPTRWWRTAYQNDTPTLGERLLAHPALRRQAGEPRWLPSWAITCAGPWSFEALEPLR